MHAPVRPMEVAVGTGSIDVVLIDHDQAHNDVVRGWKGDRAGQVGTRDSGPVGRASRACPLLAR